MTTTNEIGWHDTVDLATALRILGEKSIPAHLTAEAARCRAAGMWDANEREYHVAYRSIADHLAA